MAGNPNYTRTINRPSTPSGFSGIAAAPPARVYGRPGMSGISSLPALPQVNVPTPPPIQPLQSERTRPRRPVSATPIDLVQYYQSMQKPTQVTGGINDIVWEAPRQESKKTEKPEGTSFLDSLLGEDTNRTLLELGLNLLSTDQSDFLSAVGKAGLQTVGSRQERQRAAQAAGLKERQVAAQEVNAEAVMNNSKAALANAESRQKEVASVETDQEGFTWGILRNGGVVPLKTPDGKQVQQIPDQVIAGAARIAASLSYDTEAADEAIKAFYKSYYEQFRKEETPAAPSNVTVVSPEELF